MEPMNPQNGKTLKATEQEGRWPIVLAVAAGLLLGAVLIGLIADRYARTSLAGILDTVTPPSIIEMPNPTRPNMIPPVRIL
jgi:hypothetical protein